MKVTFLISLVMCIGMVSFGQAIPGDGDGRGVRSYPSSQTEASQPVDRDNGISGRSSLTPASSFQLSTNEDGIGTGARKNKNQEYKKSKDWQVSICDSPTAPVTWYISPEKVTLSSLQQDFPNLTVVPIVEGLFYHVFNSDRVLVHMICVDKVSDRLETIE